MQLLIHKLAANGQRHSNQTEIKLGKKIARQYSLNLNLTDKYALLQINCLHIPQCKGLVACWTFPLSGL